MGKSKLETLSLVDTYGKDAMKKSSIYGTMSSIMTLRAMLPTAQDPDVRARRPQKTDVVREKIRKIPQEHFMSSFNKWIRRWEKCVSYNREYFEKMSFLDM